MKNVIKLSFILTFAIFSLFFSCRQKEVSRKEAASDEIVLEQSTPMNTSFEMDILESSVSGTVSRSSQLPPQYPNFISSGAAMTINDETAHKFIRSSQLKFKVNNVSKATYSIEDIIIENKGFIINTSISNTINEVKTINISSDSVAIQESYNLTSSIVVRVPNSRLDTVLRQMAPLACKIDYRTVNAEDITLKLMSEQMRRIRMSKKQQRISNAISSRGRKLDDVIDAENILDSAVQQNDDAILEEYRINDQVAYSTINISLYQATTTYEQIMSRNIERIEYQSGIGERSLSALSNG